MTNRPILERFKLGTSIPLHPCSIFPRPAVHSFDRKEAIAILAALKINRPLLVRGEPGCGKTQMARAAAQVLKMPLATLVVNERTETEDLFYRYDALRRLSDANTPGKSVDDEKQYLSAGPLWLAFNHETAEPYQGRFSAKPYLGEGEDKGVDEDKRNFNNGVLLLIDEIDKADRSVPNSLLEALGNYSFNVPYIGEQIKCKEGKEPLIIITTNEEQELPPAFVRRCLVLTLTFPETIEKLADKGVAFLHRVKKEHHFTGDIKDIEDLAKQVAENLLKKREEARANGSLFLPGQAEYFDHLEAILAMREFDPTTKLDDAIDQLADLTYSKSTL